MKALAAATAIGVCDTPASCGVLNLDGTLFGGGMTALAGGTSECGFGRRNCCIDDWSASGGVSLNSGDDAFLFREGMGGVGGGFAFAFAFGLDAGEGGSFGCFLATAFALAAVFLGGMTNNRHSASRRSAMAQCKARSVEITLANIPMENIL